MLLHYWILLYWMSCHVPGSSSPSKNLEGVCFMCVSGDAWLAARGRAGGRYDSSPSKSCEQQQGLRAQQKSRQSHRREASNKPTGDIYPSQLNASKEFTDRSLSVATPVVVCKKSFELFVSYPHKVCPNHSRGRYSSLLAKVMICDTRHTRSPK